MYRTVAMLGCLLFGLLLGRSCVAQQSALTAGDPYNPRQQVQGELLLVGSTTMQQLGAVWAAGFERIHPDVKITIDCQGSETAVPQVGQEKHVVGLMSRPLSKDEQELASEMSGGSVTPILVCHDILAVVVNDANPIEGFQIDASTGQLRGPQGQSLGSKWGDLGLEVDWADLPIRLHVPTTRSGTRFVLDTLLSDDAKASLDKTEHAKRGDLTKGIASDRGGIGLVSASLGIGEGLRAVPVANRSGTFIEPLSGVATDEQYPLVRPLFVIFPGEAKNIENDVILHEFANYLVSQSGQVDVIKDGFLPLTRSELLLQKEKLSEVQVR